MLRGVDLFVEIHAEGKENIICIQRLTVRKFYSLPQHEGVLKPVWRNLPGFGERWFRQLSRAVDMDEVGLHNADDLARSRICRNQGIQGLWFSTQRHDEAASRTAHFSGKYE